MKISKQGINLIKNFEGLRLRAYKCSGGIWTIGFGHTGPDVKPDSFISSVVAEQLLIEDLERFEKAVNKFIKVPINQNQYDSLVSFIFNIGIGAFEKSTLLRLLNKGNYNLVPAQFKRWVHAGGRVSGGLIIRRNKEADLFQTPIL